MMGGASAAPPKLRDCGFFMLVVDPNLLTDGDDYARRVAAFANSLRDTRPLDPAKPVRVPFERSAAEREKRRADNAIEVADQIFVALKAVAAGA